MQSGMRKHVDDTVADIERDLSAAERFANAG